MNSKLYNSFIEAFLVTAYGWIAKYLDLESGWGGGIYQWLYFRYKRISGRETLRLMKKLAYPGSIVIDVGANIGFFTIEACRLPDLRVIAFEPEPKNFRNLNKNITKAGFTNITKPFPIALSNCTSEGFLYLSKLAPTDHKIIENSDNTATAVEMMRLDDFLVQHKTLFDRPVSLVKIDVQGAEVLVVEGMLGFLKDLNWPVLLVEYTPAYLLDAGISRKQFIKFFLELGYQFYETKLKNRISEQYLMNFKNAYTDIVMIHKSSSLSEESI